MIKPDSEYEDVCYEFCNCLHCRVEKLENELASLKAGTKN